MRPLRPLVALILLATLWLWLRVPVIRHDVARLGAAAHFTTAEHALAKGDVAAGLAQVRRGLVDLADDPRGLNLLSRILALAPPPARRSSEVALAPSSFASPIAMRTVAAALPGRRQRPLVVSLGVPDEAAQGEPTQDAKIALTPPLTRTTLPLVPQQHLAEDAYLALAAHDRRTAAGDFRKALADVPDDPRASAWRAQLSLLERHWSGSAYLFARQSGASDLAVAPVLGGGQAGVQLAYSLEPLARSPLEGEARATAPNSAPARGSQAALGLAWHPLPGTSVAVERLFALGDQARGGWTVRMSGGAATEARGVRWLDASAYGEAGAIVLHDVATYAAVQGRIGRGMRVSQHLVATAGLGVWASVQHDRAIVDRLDIGPTAALHMGSLELRADYRVRAAGNARPGSGPAMTVAAFF